jgi:hypothetical protein
MTQNQFGEPAAPASSAQVGEGANVGIAAEDEQLNRSIKKLQQVCQKTVTTAVVVASIVQSEAAQWVAKLESLSKQRVGSTEIISQTSSQIEAWFAQVNRAVESMKNRLQSMEADLVTFAGTNLIEVEDLLEAMAKVRKIVAQIDYCQAEVEVEQAAMIAEKAEIAATKAKAEVIEAGMKLKDTATVVAEKKRAAKEARKEAEERAEESERAREALEQAKAALGEVPVGAARETRVAVLATNRRLQVAANQLKQAYLKQMSTAVVVAKIAQEEATKWVAQVEKSLEHAEEPEIVSRTRVQVQEWLTQVNCVWVVENVLEQSYNLSSG